MKFSSKNILTVTACLLIVFITKAQPGCPAVNAGNNVSLPCGTSCTTLTATPFQVGATNTYTVSQIAYAPPVPYNIGTQIPINITDGDDYWSPVIYLPFTFCFFDTAYTSLIVSSNGAISFDTTNANNISSWTINGPFPANTPYDMDNSISCPYQDLDNTYQGTINWYIGGTYPCRFFVASWDNLSMFGDSNSVSTADCLEDDHQYQMLVIYETTNAIEMYIQNKDVPCDDASGTYWNGGDAVEGIENASNTTFIGVPGRNATQWSATNDAWRFTPAGPSIVSVSWLNGTTQISTDSVVRVCPGSTTTYTARAIYTPCSGAPDTVTDNVTVTLSGSINAGVDSVKNITCPGLNNGIIYAHATSSNPPVTYGWSNNATTLTINNLSPGTYVFTATDASSCQRSDTIVITNPTPLIANVQNGTVVNCVGTGSGGLTVQTVGGTVPYTYAWSNGEAGQNDTAITPGTYNVTVSDQNFCTVTASGTFTGVIGGNSVVLDTPVLSNESCFGSLNGSIVANATGGTNPYQYAWSNAQNEPAINNLPPGPYTVSVTDAGGCTATATYNITQPAVLVVDSPVIVNDNCGSVTEGQLTGMASGGTPGYTYTWTEVSNSQSFTGDTISNLPPDTYTVTVSDANNCIAAGGPFQITQTTALNLIDSINNVSCYGGNDGAWKVSIASGTPPYTYSFDQNPPITDSIISNLSLGPVEVLVIDSNNCRVEQIINITQPQPVSVNLDSVTNVSCNGGGNGTITVSATGGTPGYSYLWSNGVTGATDTALALGTYNVIVTDTNSCTGTGSFNVNQPTVLVINPADTTNIGCQGGNTGSITANVTEGTPDYTFTWTMQPGGQIYTGQTISNLAVGTYVLTVTDANGCADSATYSITSIPQLMFTVSSTPVSCYNGNNGSVLASVTSGTPPYLYSWDNGAYGTDSATGNVTAGALQINVTDANNCLADTTIILTQPNQIVIDTVSQTNVLCNGGNNGALYVNATGGTQPYTFNWSNQFIGIDNTSLTAGTYTLIIVDFNDCADTAQYIITQPAPLITAPAHVNALCYGSADGSIDVNPSGGVPEYSYLWSNNEQTQIADNLVKGLYSCTITDANGCSTIATDTVGQPDRMFLTLDSGIAVLCVGQRNGKAIVVATGDTPPYYYNATNDNVNFYYATNGLITGLDTGVYTIQIFDSVGCWVNGYVYIPPAIPDGFYAPVADSTLCYGPGYNDGAVFILDSTVQNGPYQYAIDGGVLQDSGYFQNLTAGLHMVTAVSNNGCSTQIPVVVPQPLPIVAIVTPDSVTLPLGGSQSVMVTYLNASSPAYSWSQSFGLSCANCPNPVVNAYAPGTYVVTVSMINGTATCYGSTTLYVNVLSPPKAFIPNAFTPNGDGNNDLFEIYGEDIKSVSLKVFNRWGELVYSTTNSLAGWDGTYKGVIQMPGVFSYDAVITYLDNSQENRKGTVTLIR